MTNSLAWAIWLNFMLVRLHALYYYSPNLNTRMRKPELATNESLSCRLLELQNVIEFCNHRCHGML